MKTRSEYQTERESLTRQWQEELARRVRGLQNSLYLAILEAVLGFTTDKDDRIRFTTANVNRAARIGLTIQTTNAENSRGLIGWLIERLLDVVDVNRKYFKSFVDYNTGAVDPQVRKLVLYRLGFDVDKDRLIPGGWLSEISNATPIAQSVARDVNAAIAANMPLKQFQNQFRAAFVDPGGLGYVEAHYNRFTFDLFQQVDRGVQKQYADELELNHAVYSGTVKDNTRPFCKARVNHVYTRDEIESWEDLNFQGKILVGYNPFAHLGGYNCRHHLSWITEELARRIGGINEYN